MVLGVGLIVVAMGCNLPSSLFSFSAQIKAEGMSQLYVSQTLNVDALMDDYDNEEDDKDDMEEVME
jgi:hypothetical protein